ncbi:helix-turn-helix transcriptional regulator [Kibdelosporangium aridum]|uniref:Helix-turn-helix transcriptional regulator n=1 Tax=Kibdelosporangium aridum TaxID=2030 RepID=A0A428ZJ32_KIBAR|nr:LuxR C-terminal-related transcriptional regulator [Kibdelosporangium aridum]RSM87970.1 helix-turn-helix transcriptional regulator [Kibdelosporangium aridum]
MYRTTDDRPQIQRTLTRIQETTGLPLAFGGVVDSGRQTRLTQFAGPIAGPLRGVRLDYGRGLGGKVVVLRRPVVLNDYVTAEAISHHYDHIIRAEGLHAMVAVPVIVRRVVRAVLYGALRSALPIGDRVVQSVMESARDLEQSLAVQDEVALRIKALEKYDVGDPARPQWESLREAYAELRVVANGLPDDERQRVLQVCDRLSTLGERARDKAPNLSAREVDVLACVALGWTNDQVAHDLGLSKETVKSYLRTAMRKLHARSRMEAVVTARRLGLLP